MFSVPLVNYRKALMLTVKSNRLFNSQRVGNVPPTLLLNEMCLRNTWRCRHSGLSRALLHSLENPTAVLSEPSTHWVWSTQSQTAGKVHTRRPLSTSGAWCIDVDDEMWKSENGLQRVNQRGSNRVLLRRGRRGSLRISEELKNESKTQNKWEKSAGGISFGQLGNKEDCINEETDDVIDIHSPQGLALENINEFDAQYFGEERLASSTFTSSPQNYNEPKRLFDLSKTDKQYFAPPDDLSSPKINRTINLGNLEPAFLDTTYSEENIMQDLRKKDEMELLAKEEALEAESAHIGTEKYEPHEKATKIEFNQKLDTSEHREVRLVDEKEAIVDNIPEKLKKQLRLRAEQKVREEDLTWSTQHQGFDDVEPEVQATLMSLKKKKIIKQSPRHKSYGTADSSIACSDKPCSGCGALLQCSNLDKPGFIPKEKFVPLMENMEKEMTMKTVCIRCWNLVKQKEAMDVTVNQDDYTNIIKAIRKKRALVLVMVDLLDFPCSFIPNLKDVIGNKHVCIVGNKIDLIPVDSRNCYGRIEEQLLQASINAGVCSRENVREIMLISAKSGYGIERLITKLHKNWGTQGDVYILGTANVGKSTLFNRLLESDYCKSKASYLLGKATISSWPGTTLNTLRFPIISLSKTRIAMRANRLIEEREKQEVAKVEAFKSKMAEEKLQLNKTFDNTAYVTGNVGRTFDYYKTDKELEFDVNEDDPFSISIGETRTAPTNKKSENQLPFKFHPNEFDQGKWFYDTPGVIHDQQVLTKLTLEELMVTVPGRVIQPKTLTLKPGHSFFLAGLGRLDYIQGNTSIYFTVFASKYLPVRVVPTERADAFYEEHAGYKYLEVPMGEAERMKTFPALKSVDMQMTGIGWDQSVADILFSSAGWASVTAGQGMEVHLKAYTPGGKGCLVRKPALLPHAILMRGKRVKGTPFYGIIKNRLVRFL